METLLSLKVLLVEMINKKKELRIITLVMFPVCATLLPFTVCNICLHNHLRQLKIKGNIFEATRPHHKSKSPEIYINNADPNKDWTLLN